MLSISNDELNGAPRVVEGMKIDCPNCGFEHILEGGEDEKGNHTNTALFYKCGDTSYLAAIDGKIITKFFEKGK